MNTVIYIVAMHSEAECAIQHMKDLSRKILFGLSVTEGRRRSRETENERIIVIEGGVGKVNAAAATQYAIMTYGGFDIRNFGLAGSFDANIKVGDLVTAERAVEYDIDLMDVNGTDIGTPDECDSPYLTCHPHGAFNRATVGSTDAFREYRTQAEAVVMKRLGIGVRDMECAAIAHVCQRAGVPFRSVKCISDTFAEPSMLTQYAANKARCLDILSDAFARNLL